MGEGTTCKWVWACKPASKCVLHAALFTYHAFLNNHFPCLTSAHCRRNILEHCFLCFRLMQQLPWHWSHCRWCWHIEFCPEWAVSTVHYDDVSVLTTKPIKCLSRAWGICPWVDLDFLCSGLAYGGTGTQEVVGRRMEWVGTFFGPHCFWALG